ncbi:DUF6187 family protein [Micromonospora chersina]|uniref:DUF6187 family protein n=1 Tax=Micromonospora chersina TaxID=47854 RepID=UPI003D8AF3BE
MSEAPYANPVDFDLPYLDADPVSESGLILMGMDAERILAILGLAALTADPGSAVLVIDAAWHDGEIRISFPAAVAAGVREWRRHRPALAAADGDQFRSGSPREAWASAYQVAQGAVAATAGTTVTACLAACWFRREEIDGVTGV